MRNDTVHVDLVKNEWASGLQVRAACVAAISDHVQLVGNAILEYQDLLDRPIFDPTTGSTVYLVKEKPEDAFAVLGHAFASEYTFVTAPHDDLVCPFLHGETLPMATVMEPKLLP
jgi:hypothetical protein